MVVPDEQKRKVLENLAMSRGYMGLNIFSLTALQTAYEQGGPWFGRIIRGINCKHGLRDRTSFQIRGH